MITAGIKSPFGPLVLTAEAGSVVGLRWGQSSEPPRGVLIDAALQLAEYFAGQRQVFDLPLAPGGSTFQRAFYDALLAIPFGETRTYGDLAKDLGVSAQAIGQACGANPIPILIPCHRVLGAQGLGGFSGGTGVETKVDLLRHEGGGGLLI